MVECSNCREKLGFFSAILYGKNKMDDGSILCGSCFSKWKEQNYWFSEWKEQDYCFSKWKEQQKEQKEKNKRIMIEHITKYLSNRDMGTKGSIFGCHKNKNINNLFDGDSLQRVTEHFQRLFEQVQYSNKSGMSSYKIDEIIGTKKWCEEVLNFLSDLEKMYKLFDKKGIDTDYFEILSLFDEVIKQDFNKEFDKILIPAYKIISERLGKNISAELTESVIKEFMKIPLDIEYNFYIISKLLDKFELKYDEGEIEEIIKKVQEEIDLEEFEQNLGSAQKIEIDDFEKLTGYEFEGYLKDLFNLLGYTVIETSLSRDQGADLIISKNGQTTVVQAKKYNGKVSNKAIQEIAAAKNHYKADKAIVVTNSSFTKSAIDLALSNNVELWDGSKLKDTIKNLKVKK